MYGKHYFKRKKFEIFNGLRIDAETGKSIIFLCHVTFKTTVWCGTCENEFERQGVTI
jgi:hypothetical protein